MKNSKSDQWVRIRSAAEWIIAAGVILLVIVIAISVARENYEPGVLLTAAALSLFILAFLVSILALFGWRELNHRIEATVQAQLKDAFREYQGWVRLETGLFYGRICRTIHKDRIKIERQDLLELAIANTQKAFDRLQDKPAKWVAMNNLAFYMALDGDPSHGPTARDLAEQLLERHSLTSKPGFLNTYARVVATYHTYFKEPQTTVRQARDMLQALIVSDIKKSDKENALLHLRALDKALGTGE